MARSDYTVHVRGLDQLVRDFRRIEKGLAKELQAELKEIGRDVAKEAQAVAERKGLRDSGKLIRGIKVSVRGGRAYIRSTAHRDGYEYPRIYEFGGGRRKATDPKSFRGRGPRAFLEPALMMKRDAVMAGIEDMFDRLTSEHGFGKGGRL